eukprot:symbB.v1.2.000302.t2/scaffold6.1/size569917/5
MQLEWVSDKARLRRTTKELPLTRAEEHEMHRKMHLEYTDGLYASSDSESETQWLNHVQRNRPRGSPPPSCFIHPDVEKKANQKGRPLRYREVAPPANLMLYHTAFLSVLGPGMIFALAYSRSTCDHGMDYPVPYWIWFCAAPFVLMHFVYEVRVFRYTTIPYFQVVGRFQMLAVHLGFHLWFLVAAAKSLAFQGAVFSNAVFAAKTFATASCPVTYSGEDGFERETSFNEIWQITLHQSTLAFWLREVPLSAQVFICWLLSFSPIIHALLESIPQDEWPWQIEYSLDTDNMAEYTNFLGGRFTSGDSLMLLGSGMGMFMIDEQSPSYPREKTFNILEGLSLSLQSSPTSPATNPGVSKSTEQSQNALRQMYEPLEIYTRNALTRCFLKVITLGLFNTALQIHVQISVYAMFRVTSKNEEVDFQRLVSIALSIASALFLLIHVQKVLLFASQALSKVEQVMEHINETDEPVTWRDLKNYFVWRAAEARVIRYRDYVRWSTVVFFLALSEIAPKWRYRGGSNTEDAQGSPVSPSSQHVDFEPPEGEIAQMEILRLLQASFDWDTAFHSVTAAMAVLQSGGDVQAAAVAAAKAAGDETGQSSSSLRRFWFCPVSLLPSPRVGKPLLAQHPETSVALRCVMSNHMMFDESLGFAAGPKFQTSTMQQVARFLDCQTFYREPELSVLLRALQHDQPFGRRRFLESLGSCRRRALANWQEQPIAAVLQKNWLEFDQTLSRLRAVRLRDAIEGQGLSVEAAFQKYDVDNSGLLEPMEFCRALHDLGFAFTAEEVANWVEAIDENGDYCVDNQEFLAFVKTQVNSLLTSGISGHSSLPESIGHAKKPRVHVAPTVDISSQKKLLKRQTSDVVTAAEVEHEVHLRKAQQRKAEADEERLKAEEEEGIEVLIEEELGQNPESGEGWTEYNFQAARLPKETYALGIVELVPELYGSSGKSFCLLEPGAGLVVKELQLRGTAGGRLNCFSLTLWFRVPNLPLKADRLIFLDFPRQSNDPQQFDTPEEEQNTGKLFIWKNGIIAPEGCHEPRILSKKKRRNQASRGTPAALATGEWQLRFLIQAHGKVPAGPPRQVSAEVVETGASPDEVAGETTAQGAAANAARALSGEPQGKVSYTVQITCDANSGALRVRPARGNRLASGGSGEEIFTVIARLTEERRRLIKDEMGGREGDTDFLSKRLWKKHLKSLVSGLGRSFEALGFPGGKRHFKATLTRKLRETGDEAIVAVRQTEDAAAAIADQLRSTGALEQEPEAMEDRSFAGVPKLFDVVSLSPDAGDTWGPLRNGATGEIGTIDNYGEALVYIPSRTEVQNVHWYSFRDIVLATKGGKEVAAMTLEEWQQMPSVRANYVSLEPPGPPPSPIRPGNQWAARGRLDARNLQLDLEGEGGRSVAYADASLVIEEGQVPELQGTWRAEDGSHGTFEGLKVCRESRMGGVWRFEIQAGGDPIEHAWNAWLTAHPAESSSEGDARASHLLRITGAALAGPFLSEKETVECHPTIMGEFNSLTRSLHVDMSSEGEKWDGMILDAELGTDGALRGTWQKGEQSGRWIARHIGKKNTQSCFKPQVDEGGKWDPKACVVKTNLQMISTRPQPGDKVKLSKAYKQFDGEDGCLKPGQIGTLVEDDRTSCPFLVEGPNGMSHWYNDGALVVVNKEDKELLTPLGDMFEGVALLRFPVREGLWYAELDVSKLGKSQPCVGWALQKKGSPKIVRLMAIGGKSAVKLDLGEGAPPRKKKEKGRKDEDQGENPEAKEGEDGEEVPKEVMIQTIKFS